MSLLFGIPVNVFCHFARGLIDLISSPSAPPTTKSKKL